MTDQERKLSAQQYSEALAVELRKPEPLPPMSLYRIEDELLTLLEAREDAEADGLAPEELAVFDAEINRYMLSEAKKVDAVAYSIHAATAFYEEAQKEAERLQKRADAWESRVERIKASALYAMQSHGVTRLETATNRLRIQRNGGRAPLALNEEVLQPEYIRATVTMSRADLDVLPTVYADKMKYVSQEPDNARIRAALAQRVPCPECCPGGIHQSERCDSCPRCKGTGTIANNVIGARLLDRASHLRVE